MAKQTVSLGTAPTGAGGDDQRGAFTKINSNFDEIYLAFGGSIPTSVTAAAVPVNGTQSATSTTAIFERGSNANGEYIRYADGTQVCWTGPTLVPPTGLSSILWTFPQPFGNTTYYVSLTADIASTSDPRNYVGVSQYGARTNSNVRFRTYMADQVGCSAYAIGRWK